MSQHLETKRIITNFPSFDPFHDAEALKLAMKGIGTDDKTIINILTHRTNVQRQNIAFSFKILCEKELIHELKSELHGKFEDVIVALMTPISDYLAKELHSAVSGLVIDEKVLIEILCTRTNDEIMDIREAYKRMYGKVLEEPLKDICGHYRSLLLSLCTGVRDEGPPNPKKAKQDAEALHAAGVEEWCTDESLFFAILAVQSYAQLILLFHEYQQLTGNSVSHAITESKIPEDLKKGMHVLVQCVENRPAYFAEKLHKAMEGLSTDNRTLIRIVVSRHEVDLGDIRKEYEGIYGKPLEKDITDDTSGDYRCVLVTLVTGS